MEIKRVVNTSLWNDDLVLEKFSAEDKYFWLYLLTNQYTSQLGIYHFPIKKVALDMGYSTETIYALLDRFEYKYNLIRYSQATSEIAIKNYLRHSIIRGGKPVFDCLVRDSKSVKDISLLAYITEHLSNYNIDNDTVNNFINYLKDKEVNINNNDNEESYHDSYHDSFKATSKKKNPEKYRHGEYKNVLLTDDEYNRLAMDYGETLRDKAIAYLDIYIGEKDYKSKSHNLAIRRWVIDAVTRECRNSYKPINKAEQQLNETKDALSGFLGQGVE